MKTLLGMVLIVSGVFALALAFLFFMVGGSSGNSGAESAERAAQIFTPVGIVMIVAGVLLL